MADSRYTARRCGLWRLGLRVSTYRGRRRERDLLALGQVLQKPETDTGVINEAMAIWCRCLTSPRKFGGAFGEATALASRVGQNAMARVAMRKGFDGGNDDGARNKYWIVPLPA